MDETRRTIDWEKGQWPYFFYRRLAVTAKIASIRFETFSGFYYVLKRISSVYPATVPDAPNPDYLSPAVKASIFARSDNRRRQYTPAPLDLFTSPGEGGVTIAVQPSPLEPTNPASAWGFTATPRKLHKSLNYIFQPRDVIEIELSNMDTFPATGKYFPPYIDILCEGYNLAAPVPAYTRGA
jgi:hypothetical protein